MYVCLYVHTNTVYTVHISPYIWCQKRAPEPLELEWQMVVSIWVLETQTGSSTRVVWALNYEAPPDWYWWTDIVSKISCFVWRTRKWSCPVTLPETDISLSVQLSGKATCWEKNNNNKNCHLMTSCSTLSLSLAQHSTFHEAFKPTRRYLSRELAWLHVRRNCHPFPFLVLVSNGDPKARRKRTEAA